MEELHQIYAFGAVSIIYVDIVDIYGECLG